jgi:hypothetical protein
MSVPVDPRGHRELVHSGEIEPEAMPASGWPDDARVRLLSRDPGTGAFSGLLRVPRGTRLPAFHLAADTEWLVLSGWIRVGEELRTYGWYEWAPAGTTIDPWHVMDDAELLLMPRTGAPDLTEGAGPRADEGRIRLDSETLPWTASMTKNGPKYSRSRLLRYVPETGERSTLLKRPVEGEHPVIEFHDSVEEMYSVVGDVWLRNSGWMQTGSYFWRPPYITHGPFRTEKGGISYLYVDKELINFFVDDPGATPESNVVEAERQRREGIV